MPVTSPYEEAAAALEAIITTEFTPEGVVPIHDMLHDSIGFEGRQVGIAPQYDSPSPGGYTVQETYLEVRWFGAYTLDVNPNQAVDPRPITNLAERFRRACLNDQINTARAWYFNVERVEYPDDPTGNKTRFIATVRCYGQNAQVVETLG